jgi:hypothetical protein
MNTLVRILALLSLSMNLTAEICDKPCKNICNASKGVIGTIAIGLQRLGSLIAEADVPLIGRLNDFLPCAVVSYCLEEFPRQTMLFVTAGIIYAIYRKTRSTHRMRADNEEIHQEEILYKADRKNDIQFDDDFFRFDEKYIEAGTTVKDNPVKQTKNKSTHPSAFHGTEQDISDHTSVSFL